MSRARDELLASGTPRWTRLEHALPSDRAMWRLDPAEIGRIAALYRALCADLSRARSLGCGDDVIGHLDGLAARAHNLLYAGRRGRQRRLLDTLLFAFPRTLRASRRFLLVAALAFLVPMGIGAAGAVAVPDFATGVLPGSMLERLTESYAEGFEHARAGGEDVAMAGFYVYNNVGIAFRCFATGILFGLGSLFYLVYNGLVIGTVMGWVASHGAAANLFTFVCGHSPFELTAIVIAGATGLRMGWAVVETGGRTRRASLRAEAPALVTLVGGVAAMLGLAALIEGFWSPSPAPAPVKWAFAGVASVLVALFLVLAGRGGADAVPGAAAGRREPRRGA